MKINALVFRGGVNASNNETFRLDALKSNLMFLLRRIKMLCHSLTKHLTLCHPEFISGSQEHEMLKQVQHDNVFSIPSYRANEVRCGIFKNILRKIPQCVSLMRDDIKIRHTFKKAIAFTLAETLIVMGIIGVVAALTIPNLNSSTADKEKVAKVQKIYSNLSDAFGRAQAVYGPYGEWFQNDTNDTAIATRFGERMTEFMKVSKTCKLTTGCASTSKAYWYDGSEMASNLDNSHKDYYNVILADGTAISFNIGAIHVDIDGPNKGKTKEGVDLFTFLIEQDENNNYNVLYFGGNGNSTGNLKPPYDILGWIILNGNMDYLKATLTSDTYKCPNGKTLNWQNQTSCK